MPSNASVLDDIVAGVLEDLAGRQQAVSAGHLRALIAQQAPATDPLPAFREPGLGVIAEVKRKSPSKGHLAEIADPAALARAYAAGGADAISVLTEQRRFNGSLADFDAVRASVDTPLLRKDFVVTEYQVVEARAHGADLVLLIVAALDDALLKDLHDTVLDLGMTSLVEVHDEAEIDRALALGPALVGVNARNLKTLEVDPDAFGRLGVLLPDDVVKVAESGITDAAAAARYAAEGADVVLVGEALVKDGDPTRAVAAMRSVGR